MIGSGFMGKSHTIGFASAARVFDLPFDIDFHTVCDVDLASAENARRKLGYRHASGDWRSLLDNPQIDIIDITTPNAFHHEMALAAAAAGKHVYCEKPLAPTAAAALEMTEAAETAGVVTQMGFNYLKNPLFAVAREMIRSGELGEIRHYRGVHIEDFMVDAAQPMSWRNDPVSGGGALADLGSHALATARFLLGPIASVRGRCTTVIPERPAAEDVSRSIPVVTDDIACAFLTFETGITGTLEANWIASGRKMQHDFEVYGSRGSVLFTQERLNELRVYDGRAPSNRQGFRTIVTGPMHPPYGDFCIAPGHQLGFNDLKAIEVRDFLDALSGKPCVGPDFREGYEVQRLVDAIYLSDREQRMVEL